MRNVERGLAASGPDRSLYFAVAHAASAASSRPQEGGEPISASAGAALLAISCAADEWHRSPGELGAVAALLGPLAGLLADLDRRRSELDARAQMDLEIAQILVTQYCEALTPRRRRWIRWPWSRA